MITSCKNWVIQGNSAKSTNNPMSSFDLSEEIIERSPIYQAVNLTHLAYCIQLYLHETYHTALSPWDLSLILMLEPSFDKHCSYTSEEILKQYDVKWWLNNIENMDLSHTFIYLYLSIFRKKQFSQFFNQSDYFDTNMIET